jgi:hypothetical protein
LDLQVRSKLVNCFSEFILGFMHILLIGNNGENHQGLGEGQGVKEEELGCPHQGGVQVLGSQNLTSQKLTPWPHTEWDLDVLYIVGTIIS